MKITNMRKGEKCKEMRKMEGNRRSEGWSNNGRNDGIEVREKKELLLP